MGKVEHFYVGILMNTVQFMKVRIVSINFKALATFLITKRIFINKKEHRATTCEHIYFYNDPVNYFLYLKSTGLDQ